MYHYNLASASQFFRTPALSAQTIRTKEKGEQAMGLSRSIAVSYRTNKWRNPPNGGVGVRESVGLDGMGCIQHH